MLNASGMAEQGSERMDKTFDVEKFMARIGEMSVVQFDDAKAATSPSAVGDAMESPVRDQLQQILPRGIGGNET